MLKSTYSKIALFTFTLMLSGIVLAIPMGIGFDEPYDDGNFHGDGTFAGESDGSSEPADEDSGTTSEYWDFVTSGDAELDPYSDEYRVRRCDECRDLNDFPEDAGHFIWNEIFGPEATGEIAGELKFFKVENEDGQVVLVWFDDTQGNLSPWSLITIRVEKPDGRVIEYKVLANRSKELPVGEKDESEDASEDYNEGEESEDFDDSDGQEDYGIDLEYDDVGNPDIEIIEPDENGEYPEWEREL